MRYCDWGKSQDVSGLGFWSSHHRRSSARDNVLASIRRLGWPSIRPKQAAQKIGAAHADVTVNLLLHIRGTLRFILTRYSEDFLKEAEASAVRESRAISSETQMGAAAGYERLAWRIGGG